MRRTGWPLAPSELLSSAAVLRARTSSTSAVLMDVSVLNISRPGLLGRVEQSRSDFPRRISGFQG